MLLIRYYNYELFESPHGANTKLKIHTSLATLVGGRNVNIRLHKKTDHLTQGIKTKEVGLNFLDYVWNRYTVEISEQQ